jgi:hypothetical protein
VVAPECDDCWLCDASDRPHPRVTALANSSKIRAERPLPEGEVKKGEGGKPRAEVALMPIAKVL